MLDVAKLGLMVAVVCLYYAIMGHEIVYQLFNDDGQRTHMRRFAACVFDTALVCAALVIWLVF